MQQEQTELQAAVQEIKDSRSNSQTSSPADSSSNPPEVAAANENDSDSENDSSELEESGNSATPDKKRNRKTASDRIRELVSQKRELEAKLKLQQAPVTTDFAEPKEEAFGSYGEYQEAKAAWRAVKMLQEREQQQTLNNDKISQQAQWEVMQKNYVASSEIARKIYPDFDAVVQNSPVLQINAPEFVQAVGATDNSAEVTYFLSKNPELVNELLNLRFSPAALGARIGEISARVSFNRGKAARKVEAPSTLTTVNASANKGALDSRRALSELPPEQYIKWKRQQKESQLNRSA